VEYSKRNQAFRFFLRLNFNILLPPLQMPRILVPTAALLFALLLLTGLQASAQDSVVLRNGAVITGKVLQIGPKRVQLEVPGSEGIRHRSRDLRLVKRIAFAGGTSWPDARDLRRSKEKDRITQRRIRLNDTRNFSYFTAPAIQVIGHSRGLAAGLGYERKLKPYGKWSAAINGFAFATNTTGFSKTEPMGPYADLAGGYIAPGLQFHPFGHCRRSDLALGIDIPIGMLNRSEGIFDGSVQTGTITRRDLMLGTEVTAELRIYSSRAATIMFTAAGGPLILNNAVYGGTFRLGFCFGLRY